jgi:hypothetical protein
MSEALAHNDRASLGVGKGTPGPGRPTLYCAETHFRVCHLIAQGKTFRDIERDEGIPASTIWEWRGKHPVFREDLARAREQSAEALEHEALDAARDAGTQEQVLKAKGVLEAIKWTAGKRNPQVYGEKVTHEFAGELTVSVDVGDQLSRVLELQRLVGLAPQIEGTAEPAAIEPSTEAG